MNASFPVIILYVDMYTSWWSAAGGREVVVPVFNPPPFPLQFIHVWMCVCVWVCVCGCGWGGLKVGTTRFKRPWSVKGTKLGSCVFWVETHIVTEDLGFCPIKSLPWQASGTVHYSNKQIYQVNKGLTLNNSVCSPIWFIYEQIDRSI